MRLDHVNYGPVSWTVCNLMGSHGPSKQESFHIQHRKGISNFSLGVRLNRFEFEAMTLMKTMPREVVVIVDTLSTGAPLACSRGFLVVVVWSKKVVERTSHTQSSDQVEQVDAYQTYLVVKEQASTPATVKAIEGALYPLGAFEITACIPGSE